MAGRGRPADRRSAGRPSLARLARSPLAAAVAATAVALALVVAWSQWQPLRSEQATSASEVAYANGQISLAIADAKTAIARDGLDLTPLTDLADAYAAGGSVNLAQTTLLRGVAQQPSNSASWLALWQFDSGPYGFELSKADIAEGKRALAEELYLNPEYPQNGQFVEQLLETLR